MDTLVFDIETKNFFTDPGVGRDNFDALAISMVCAYSYAKDDYFSFEENQIVDLADLMRAAGRIVGFSSNRYDIPVLNHYFQKLGARNPNIWAKERIDLLEIVESATGARVSLSRLAEANLGVAKEHHGSEAALLYREGRIEELRAYCLNDVKLTKDIYDLYEKQRWLMVPKKETGELMKIEFAKKIL